MDKHSQYEIYENVYGEYRINNIDTDELVTFGGTELLFDNIDDAVKFLKENN